MIGWYASVQDLRLDNSIISHVPIPKLDFHLVK